MSSQVMCFCKSCKANRVGIKSGLSGGGHFVGLVLTLLTGLLALPVYILMMLCSGSVRCSVCGNISKKL
jgi:hypothetical protein